MQRPAGHHCADDVVLIFPCILDQATFSRHCYPRTTLPGCKGSLYRFERRTLLHLYSATFSVIFVHLAAIVASLLCSNHVNVTFGKGLTPRAYRLDMGHVRRNAINIIRILSASSSELNDVQHILHVDNDAETHSETKDTRREWDGVRRDMNQSD